MLRAGQRSRAKVVTARRAKRRAKRRGMPRLPDLQRARQPASRRR